MKNKNINIEKIVEIRNFVISEYKKIDFSQNTKTSMMTEYDHGMSLEKIIRKIDKTLKGHVEFKSEKQ